MRIHVAKVSQANGKEAGRVPQMFKCIAASPDIIVRDWLRIRTGWCCRTPCHLSQSCETEATVDALTDQSAAWCTHLRAEAKTGALDLHLCGIVLTS